MNLLVVVVTVACVWIFFALLLAGCAHGLGPSRGRDHASTAAAWIGEEHAPVVRLRGDATIPPSHPLARAVVPAGRHVGRPSA